MGFFSEKIQRLQEATCLVGRHAVDWKTRARLSSCYLRRILRNRNDAVIDLKLRLENERYPFRMRRSDLFTLGEVLHQAQYRTDALIAKTPTIVDAGANIGAASLWFHARHPDATIHAFEPEPANFALLQHNLSSVSSVKLIHAALGRKDGRARLGLAEHGAMHSIVDADADAIDVACRSLGSYLEELRIKRVDVLKLDVEGSELEVLEGLGDRIGTVDIIVGEVHERKVDSAAFHQELKCRGFAVVTRRDYPGGRAEGVHGFEASRS